MYGKIRFKKITTLGRFCSQDTRPWYMWYPYATASWVAGLVHYKYFVIVLPSVSKGKICVRLGFAHLPVHLASNSCIMEGNFHVSPTSGSWSPSSGPLLKNIGITNKFHALFQPWVKLMIDIEKGSFQPSSEISNIYLDGNEANERFIKPQQLYNHTKIHLA